MRIVFYLIVLVLLGLVARDYYNIRQLAICAHTHIVEDEAGGQH